MPKKMEKALARYAEAKGYRKGSGAWRRYVYGTMSEIRAEQIERKYNKSEDAKDK